MMVAKWRNASHRSRHGLPWPSDIHRKHFPRTWREMVSQTRPTRPNPVPRRVRIRVSLFLSRWTFCPASWVSRDGGKLFGVVFKESGLQSLFLREACNQTMITGSREWDTYIIYPRFASSVHETRVPDRMNLALLWCGRSMVWWGRRCGPN